MGDTQPKDSSGSDGMTREEKVRMKCEELLETLPDTWKEEFIREKVDKRPQKELEFVLKKKDVKGEKGFNIPLCVFLYQECMRMKGVIDMVRDTLTNLIMAID